MPWAGKCPAGSGPDATPISRVLPRERRWEKIRPRQPLRPRLGAERGGRSPSIGAELFRGDPQKDWEHGARTTPNPESAVVGAKERPRRGRFLRTEPGHSDARRPRVIPHMQIPLHECLVFASDAGTGFHVRRLAPAGAGRSGTHGQGAVGQPGTECGALRSDRSVRTAKRRGTLAEAAKTLFLTPGTASRRAS